MLKMKTLEPFSAMLNDSINCLYDVMKLLFKNWGFM